MGVRVRLAEAKLQHLADSSESACFVSAARYPRGSNRYLTTFSNIRSSDRSSPAAVVESNGGDVGSKGGEAQQKGGTSFSESPSSGTNLGPEGADTHLDVARQQLKAAVDGLQRLQQLDTVRVAGRDTAELFHFFNQPTPPLQPTQHVMSSASLLLITRCSSCMETRCCSCCHRCSCRCHLHASTHIIATSRMTRMLLRT